MEAKEALQAINEALFPLPRKEGDALIYDDAYWNLAGARIDLERVGSSRVCIRTIERVQKQLADVSEILQKMGLQGKQC